MILDIQCDTRGIPMGLTFETQIGRLVFKRRHIMYQVAVYRYLDKEQEEFVWTAYKWTGDRWEKMQTMTREQEQAFPKKVAELADEFYCRCTQNLKSEVLF